MDSLQFYRNDITGVFSVTKDDIIKYLNKLILADGSIVLGRYSTETNDVKTIIGVAHNNGIESGITLFDSEKDEHEDVKQIEIDSTDTIKASLSGNVYTLDTKISENFGNIIKKNNGLFVEGYTKGDGIDIIANQISLKLNPDSSVNDFLYLGENGLSGKIELKYVESEQKLYVAGYDKDTEEPILMGEGVDMSAFVKDCFLKTVELIVVDDEHPIISHGAKLQNGTYLAFTWNVEHSETNPTYIRVDDLVKPIVEDGYVGVEGISISNKQVSIKLADDAVTKQYLLLKKNTTETPNDIRLWFDETKILNLLNSYTKEMEGRYVNVSGDTMHGDLIFNQNPSIADENSPRDARIVFGGTHNTKEGFSIGYDKENQKINIYTLSESGSTLLTPLIDKEGNLYEAWVREKKQNDEIVKTNNPTPLAEKYVQIVDLEDKVKEIAGGSKSTTKEFVVDEPDKSSYYLSASGDACVFVSLEYDGDDDEIESGACSDILVITKEETTGDYNVYCSKNKEKHVYQVITDVTLNKIIRLGVNNNITPTKVTYSIISGGDNVKGFETTLAGNKGIFVPTICECDGKQGGDVVITSTDKSIDVSPSTTSGGTSYDLKYKHRSEGGYETAYLETFHWDRVISSGANALINKEEGYYFPIIQLHSNNVAKCDISFEILSRERNDNSNFYGRYMFTSRSDYDNLYCLEGFNGSCFDCIEDVVYVKTEQGENECTYTIYKRMRGDGNASQWDYWQINIISRNLAGYSDIKYYTQYSTTRTDVIRNNIGVMISNSIRCKDKRDATPIGSVIAFSKPLSEIPFNWCICDGRTITNNGEVVKYSNNVSVGYTEICDNNEGISRDKYYSKWHDYYVKNGIWIDIIDLTGRFILGSDENGYNLGENILYALNEIGGKDYYNGNDVPPHYHTFDDMTLNETADNAGLDVKIDSGTTPRWDDNENMVRPWWTKTIDDIYKQNPYSGRIGNSIHVYNYMGRETSASSNLMEGYVKGITFNRPRDTTAPYQSIITYSPGTEGGIDFDNNFAITRLNATHYNGVEASFGGSTQMQNLNDVKNAFQDKNGTVRIMPPYYSLYYIVKWC